MKKKSVTLLVLVSLICAALLIFSACNTDSTDNSTNKSVEGTYYLYEDGATNYNSWVTLSTGNRWSDSDDMSGSYTLEDGNIVFYVTFDGAQEELLSGTLVDNKLSVGALGVFADYYLSGKAPDSNSNPDNGNQEDDPNNSDNNSSESEDLDPETLMEPFEYEKDGDKYIITGAKSKNVKSLYVPEFVVEIREEAFKDCEKLESITVFSRTLTKDYTDETAHLQPYFDDGEFPESLKSITINGDFPENTTLDFYEASFVEKIIFTGSVKKDFKPESFSCCYNLRELVLPDGITELPMSILSNCPSLLELNIPDGVTTIDYYAFSDCSSLQQVIIPESVTTIGNGAFSNCSSLQSVVLPANITTIGESAFSACSSLESVIIPEKVTTIGRGAFARCTSLSSFKLGKNVSNMDASILYGCSKLATVEIDNGNTTFAIKNGVLINVQNKVLIDSLNSAAIPSDGSVTTIASCAFSNNSNITNIVIPDCITEIGSSAFSSCDNLVSVIIPSGITKIDDWTFDYCKKLTNVVIPDGVVLIGLNAFSGCSNLTSVTLPTSLETLGDYAFSSCGNLKVIYKGTSEQYRRIDMDSTWMNATSVTLEYLG